MARIGARAVGAAVRWLPRGNRVAIVTNAGGPGVLTTDAAIHEGLRLASFSPATTEVFRKSPLPEGLANTLVLDEEPVLIARQRGKSARTYHLPKDRAFAVGRAPGVNSLQIDDPTVSGQHFRLVPKDGEFYLVDLDTTNGTMVNHERVKVRKLASGDVIQAGAVQLEFALQLRRLS